MTDLAFVSNAPGRINFVQVDPQQAAAALAPLAASQRVNHNRLCGIGDLLGAGQAYIAFTKRGDALALVVVQKIDRQGGRELEVRAALQLSGRGDLTETVLPELERQIGWDCRQMSIQTKRRGLVKKLTGAGYQTAATVLRKAINT